MLVNGKPQQHVHIDERAFNYGDGVFETIRLQDGQPILMEQHMQRLYRSCERLGLHCNFEALVDELDYLQDQFTDYGVLKIIISRGVGGRGYRPEQGMMASRIITLHALPDLTEFDQQAGVKVFVCEHRLSEQKQLAGLKHLNRLDQVMAAAEWPDDSFFEGLVSDQQGSVIEGTRSNLFFVENGKLQTPELDNCGVAGILRDYLLDNLGDEIILCRDLSLQRLLQAEEVFLCNSVMGVWPVNAIEQAGTQQIFSPGPFTQKAMNLFDALLTINAAT